MSMKPARESLDFREGVLRLWLFSGAVAAVFQFSWMAISLHLHSFGGGFPIGAGREAGVLADQFVEIVQVGHAGLDGDGPDAERGMGQPLAGVGQPLTLQIVLHPAAAELFEDVKTLRFESPYPAARGHLKERPAPNEEWRKRSKARRICFNAQQPLND